ncbi:hypothetical protein IEE91_13845 [Kocuria sp. cx-455]|uniref:hypothetical protein n=1 Tax=Kocuria sp. cx-455 TaxID=2771377 RepID=UPI001682454B|nr:hypothetical protein [Kocuria sp. cx-455]MBD2766246.1 hypothetical protein [Kocuria sp. cx-455]
MELVEVAVIVVMVLVIISLGVRLTPLSSKPSRLIVALHLLLLVPMVLAISPVYLLVDGWLGGLSLANLLSHLLFVILGWMAARLISRPLNSSRQSSALLGAWVLAVGLIGTTVTYLVMPVTTSSRGLDTYHTHPLFPVYWTFTYVTFLVPSLWLVPRLRHALTITGFRSLRVPFAGMLTSFVMVWPVVAMYYVGSWWPEAIPLRELCVAVAGCAMMFGFLTLPLSGKKAQVHRTGSHAPSHS